MAEIITTIYLVIEIISIIYPSCHMFEWWVLQFFCKCLSKII